MKWTIKSFDELTPHEVYRILKARCEVFVVEQNCPYLDPDDLDYISKHIFAEEDGEIAAYCRIIPKGKKYPEVSIGRIITTSKFRRRGLGRGLMECAIGIVTREMGEHSIRILGQAYLRAFYESLGFRAVSEEICYEDDIEHYEMLRTEI